MAALPDDIERQILLRLPVKTLKRFECASKAWYSLISSSQFVRDHFRRSQNTPLLLTVCEDDADPLTLHFSTYTTTTEDATTLNNFSKRLPYRFSAIHPVQSILGYVCLATPDHHPSFLLCNPSVQEITLLPPVPDITSCFGFGFAASTQHFKAVNFFVGEDGDCFCEVFTLGTRQWREARNHPPYACWGVAPFLHGALHLPPNGHEEVDYISAFDVDTEEYYSIPLPEGYLLSILDCDISNCKNEKVHLTELGGLLSLTIVFDARLVIWLLKDYTDEEWVKRYNIDLSSVVDLPPGSFVLADVLGIMGNGSVLLKLGDELWCHDPLGRIYPLNINMADAAMFYVQSLVLGLAM